MRCRVKFLTATYLWTILVFIVAKVCFMLFCQEGHDFSVGDMWQVISHGLSLDLSTALYFLIVPFLVVMVSVWWQGKVLTKILQVYFIIIAFAFALAFVADTSLYPFWGFKLDASCLQYLDTPTEAMASVTTSYLLLRLLAVILTTALIAFGYIEALQHSIEAPQKRIEPLQHHTEAPQKRTILPPALHKASETVFYLICIPLIVIGIRGGLDESTTNIGQVYFSQNQFLNHSAVNPVFSFLASFEKTASNNVNYEFMEETACEQIISRLYNTESIECDTLLNTQTPNIIVILMEGCGGDFTEIGGRQDITPNLNILANEGIYFTNCYGNTWRTDRGTACTYSGYPSFPTMSVMKMPAKTRTLPNIARTLKEERNYHTHYLYGGDINFTNMRSYLIGGGFEHLTWKADYSAEDQASAEWGVRDDITFETLYQMSTTLKAPFLIGFSTLSSHEPWDVPVQKFDDKVLNAFYYLDQCIGKYVERLQQSPVWDKTLIILLPDHGINYMDIDELHPLRNHIPMIWAGGAVKAPKHIEVICNQTDLPATLLGQLGVRHDDFTFSRDVLSKTYTQPLAIHTYNNGFSLVDSTGFTVYDLNTNQTIKGSGDITIGKAILQAASKDLNQR